MGKSAKRRAGWIILGDQLFAKSHYSKWQGVPAFMCEDIELCQHFRYHKLKIAFFLTAMRDFADEMQEEFRFTYNQLEARPQFFTKLDQFVKKHDLEHLISFEIEDKFFAKKLSDFCQKRNLDWQQVSSPGFLTARQEFAVYLANHKKPFMKTFYEERRRKLKILIDKNGQPEGGQFSFDTENRKPFKGKEPVPRLPEVAFSRHWPSVVKEIQKYFSDHPGELQSAYLPTHRKGALLWLRAFLKERLSLFGDYEDAIHSEHAFLFHSVLTPFLNCGLLTPNEVVEETIKVYRQGGAPLNSVEGFIRQVIGWREFVRGIYQNFSDRQESQNFWGHERSLKPCWYSASTGLPPVDDVIQKLNRYGYSHHIERLMVMSNIFLLLNVHPQEVHRWFMEMYIDSADWVMGPNVYGMGQFSDGGLFATKPYICGSNYWLKMSNYKKAEWCDGVDGLYWQFIEKHREFFLRNPRLSMMVKLADKIPKDKRKRIFSAADELRDQLTNEGPAYV